MTEISVKTKLWSLIIIMLLFIVGVGAVGFVTLNEQAKTFKELDDLDNAFLNLTDQVAIRIIELRRYEKDYFLNIGNADKQQEYLKKFQEIDAGMPQLIMKLMDLAHKDEHVAHDLKNKVAALAEPYNNYRDGFNAVVQRLKADPRLTPQQANHMMTQFKVNIPVLEETTAALVKAGNEVADRVAAQAIQRGQDARKIILLAVAIAVVLAGILGSALCRSIYRAIFREGLRRMAHRI